MKGDPITSDDQQLKTVVFKGKMTKDQEKIIKIFIGVISEKIIGLSSSVLDSIFRLSLRSWAEESKMDPRILITFKIDDVAHHIRAIIDIFGKRLAKILKNPSEKDVLS